MFRLAGRAATVATMRPKRRVTRSPEMLLGMYKAWRLLEDDGELYCAILTANGDTFCAGMDLKAGAEGQQRSTEEFMEVMMFHEIREMEYAKTDLDNAHDRAVNDEILYVLKHFEPKQQKAFFK